MTAFILYFQVSFAFLGPQVLEARNLPNSLADQFIRRLQKRAADADPEPVAQEQDSYGIPSGSPVGGGFGSSPAGGGSSSASSTYNSGSTSFTAPISAVGAQYSAGSSSVSAPVVTAGNSYSGPSNTGSISSSNSYNGPSSSGSSSSSSVSSGSSYSGPLLTSVPVSAIASASSSQASYGTSQENCQVTRSLTNTGNCQQGGQVVVEAWLACSKSPIPPVPNWFTLFLECSLSRNAKVNAKPRLSNNVGRWTSLNVSPWTNR